MGLAALNPSFITIIWYSIVINRRRWCFWTIGLYVCLPCCYETTTLLCVWERKIKLWSLKIKFKIFRVRKPNHAMLMNLWIDISLITITHLTTSAWSSGRRRRRSRSSLYEFTWTWGAFLTYVAQVNIHVPKKGFSSRETVAYVQQIPRIHSPCGGRPQEHRTFTFLPSLSSRCCAHGFDHVHQPKLSRSPRWLTDWPTVRDYDASVTASIDRYTLYWMDGLRAISQWDH